MKFKKELVVLLLFVVISVLGACDNSSEEVINATNENNIEDGENNQNLLNLEELVEGEWIDTKGEYQENDDMYFTEPVDYSSTKDYALYANGYVAYYDSDKFIKTIRYYGAVKEMPYILEPVDEADTIILSFSKQWIDEIELIEQ